MDQSRRAVVAHLYAVPNPLESEVTWGYDPADPYAVTMAIHLRNGKVAHWVFARDLLSEGICGAAGVMDVRVTADDDHVTTWIKLASPTGEALFMFKRTDIADFLDETERAVPYGQERGQYPPQAVEAELQALMGEAA